LLATASGTDICIWDVAGGGRLMQRIAVHKKTATGVLVTQLLGSKPHVVSAGLDGHVKVGIQHDCLQCPFPTQFSRAAALEYFCYFMQALDANTYSPVTIHKHHVPVTCLAASSSGDLLVVGGANGTLIVHKRQTPKSPSAAGVPRLR
jgi:WD40 repeat protein